MRLSFLFLLRAILKSYIYDVAMVDDLSALDDCEPFIAVLLRHLQVSCMQSIFALTAACSFLFIIGRMVAQPTDDAAGEDYSPESRDVHSQTPRTLLAAMTSRLTDVRGRRESEGAPSSS